MSENMIFTIPNHGATLARLIEAVPSDWAWVDGRLEPPAALVKSGQVARTAGYAIRRFHSIKPTIAGQNDRPDLCEILIERKLPLFINFDEAGFQERTASLEVAKKIAAHHVRLGYRGFLIFSAGCYDNSKFDKPARCELQFAPGEQYPYNMNWRIDVSMTSAYGGKPEHIAAILEACRAESLTPVEDD